LSSSPSSIPGGRNQLSFSFVFLSLLKTSLF
jgi:hypothetical protein